MKIYQSPNSNLLDQILKRPVLNYDTLEEQVAKMLRKIKLEGDSAIQAYTKAFDQVDLNQPLVSEEEWETALSHTEATLQQAIDLAYQNIYRFHAAQQEPITPIETIPGITCWRKSTPIQKVGLYVPGGTAPLFSTVLMLGVPAQIAGCEEVVMCTPPQKNGQIHPAMLYAAKLAGVTKVFKIGGVQAIGGMAYGTESIPQVYKIFGPGNQYVTMAKQLVSRNQVAIDMPAGPSEVMVYADEEAPPAFVAADLLSQAEHGMDSQVVLVAHQLGQIQEILRQIEHQLAQLPRAEIAKKALENSAAIVVENADAALEVINFYAPEHLILSLKDPKPIAEKVINAGSIFLGYFTPESLGDYASGTNHTLPTNGYARVYSGVSLDSFVKKITFQEATIQGIQQIGPAVEVMADAEELMAHKKAISIRLEQC